MKIKKQPQRNAKTAKTYFDMPTAVNLSVLAMRRVADQQLSLIKAEVRESTAKIKPAAGGMIGAAVVGIAGLGVLLMGMAYLLAEAIESLVLATLIVGAATLLIAYILYRSAASKMASTSLAPDRTQRTLQRTPDAVRGEL